MVMHLQNLLLIQLLLQTWFLHGQETASQYVNGAGDLTNISTLPNTTYDLSSVQNGADADIKLIGSDATTDIV